MEDVVPDNEISGGPPSSHGLVHANTMTFFKHVFVSLYEFKMIDLVLTLNGKKSLSLSLSCCCFNNIYVYFFLFLTNRLIIEDLLLLLLL